MGRIDRNYYLKQLIEKRENRRVKVVTGIRRCGKSVLLFDIFGDYLKAEGVTDEQLIMLKLDVARNARYRNPLELDKYLRDKIADTTKQYYVLLDEIQEVSNIPNPWLDDKDATIGFVVVTYGGLPRVMALKTDREKSQYLQDLIKKTYLTDVIERNHIQKDISVLDDLLNIVASSIGSLTNPKKLENTFASVKHTKIDDSTISIYLGYFAEAYILRRVEQYDIKGKKYINTPQKYYLTDVGLRNAQLNFRQQEETHLMENVIYNELSARGLLHSVGLRHP